MKTQIFDEFVNSGITIKSKKLLKQYIDYCLSNNKNVRIPGVTEHHHILPKSKTLFAEFSNLRKNPWNGSHLTFRDHYIAHAMLVEAVDNESIIYAWNRMNKNFTIDDQKELLGVEKYQELREKHRSTVVNYNKTRIVTKETRLKMGRNNRGFVTVTDLKTGESKRVTKKEFDENDNLVAGTPGMTVAIDTRTGKCVFITVDELNNNEFYQHNTKGMVVAIDTRTCERVHVTQEDFDNFDYYVGVSGKKISIFNEKSELVLSMPRQKFKEFTKEQKWPWIAFEQSELNNGKPLYLNFARKEDETRTINNGNIRFKGWYAISEPYIVT